MAIDSKAGNKRAIVTFQPPIGHLSLAPLTRNYQWRITMLTWTQGTHHEPKDGVMGQTKGKSGKTS